jgi:hypothetical protein
MDVEALKDVTDVAAITVTASTFMLWLPPTASILTIAWLGIRIWESDTVQALRKTKKKLK